MLQTVHLSIEENNVVITPRRDRYTLPVSVSAGKIFLHDIPNEYERAKAD